MCSALSYHGEITGLNLAGDTAAYLASGGPGQEKTSRDDTDHITF